MLYFKIYNFKIISAVCNTERRLGLPASNNWYIQLTARQDRRASATKILRRFLLAAGRRVSSQRIWNSLHEGRLYARRLMMFILLTARQIMLLFNVKSLLVKFYLWKLQCVRVSLFILVCCGVLKLERNQF